MNTCLGPEASLDVGGMDMKGAPPHHQLCGRIWRKMDFTSKDNYWVKKNQDRKLLIMASGLHIESHVKTIIVKTCWI